MNFHLTKQRDFVQDITNIIRMVLKRKEKMLTSPHWNIEQEGSFLS